MTQQLALALDLSSKWRRATGQRYQAIPKVLWDFWDGRINVITAGMGMRALHDITRQAIVALAGLSMQESGGKVGRDGRARECFSVSPAAFRKGEESSREAN